MFPCIKTTCTVVVRSTVNFVKAAYKAIVNAPKRVWNWAFGKKIAAVAATTPVATVAPIAAPVAAPATPKAISKHRATIVAKHHEFDDRVIELRLARQANGKTKKTGLSAVLHTAAVFGSEQLGPGWLSERVIPTAR